MSGNTGPQKAVSDAALPISQRAVDLFDKMGERKKKDYIKYLLDPTSVKPVYTRRTLTKSQRAKKRKAQRSNRRKGR